MKYKPEFVLDLGFQIELVEDKVKTKIRALIEYYSGAPVQSIANKFSVNRNTITSWAKRYEAGGVTALVNHPFKKASILKEDQLTEIRNDLNINPLNLGLPYSIWDGNLLQYYISRKLHLNLSIEKCNSLIQQDGSKYSFQNYIADNIDIKAEFVNLVRSELNNAETNVWLVSSVPLGYEKIKKESQWFIYPDHRWLVGILFSGNHFTYYDVYALNKKHELSFFNNALNKLISQEISKCKSMLFIVKCDKRYIGSIFKLIKAISPDKYHYRFIFIPRNYSDKSNYNPKTYKLGLLNFHGEPQLDDSRHLKYLTKRIFSKYSVSPTKGIALKDAARIFTICVKHAAR